MKIRISGGIQHVRRQRVSRAHQTSGDSGIDLNDLVSRCGGRRITDSRCQSFGQRAELE